MKKFLYTIIICISFCFLSACSKSQQAYTKTDFFFDTAVTLTIYDTPQNADSVNATLDEAMALCKKFDSMFSHTKEGSEIYKLNNAGGEWVALSDETLSLLQSSIEYCEMTGGKIDITLATVKELWDFEQSGNNISMPASAQIADKLNHVSYSFIEIKGNNVRFTDPETQIDFGFIAKGYVADQIRAFLYEKNVKSALINLGGNIAVIGSKPDNTPFQIGIQEPFAPAGTYCLTIPCSESVAGTSSIVTSGIYERYYEYGGEIYHHILDSETGFPVQNDLNSVTIITDSSLHADALSTTCLLLGLDKGRSYIEDLPDVEAIFITTDGEIVDTRNK